VDRLLQFLLSNPILLFIVGAWLVGAISNVLKVAKQRREAEARAGRRVPTPGTASSSPAESASPAAVGPRSAEEIAREMRRILGVETEPASPPPAWSRRTEASVPAEPAEVAAPAYREPTQGDSGSFPVVVPNPLGRRLPTRVDPHVGEAMAHRASPHSHRVGAHAQGHELGRLGGRVHKEGVQRVQAKRFALDDLKRAFVLGEILGPPLAVRRRDERDS
jgi:hypothetical protein